MKIKIKLALFVVIMSGFVSLTDKSIHIVYAQTPTPAAPSVTTNATTNQSQYITYSVATLNGQIDSIGSATVTKRGFRYGISGTYTDEVCSVGTFSTGTFSLTTGGSCGSTSAATLQCNRTYDVQAYAENSAGRTYGSKRSFNSGTCPTIPIIASNVTATGTTTTSINLTATITSTGGTNYPVTTRGFEYGTTAIYGQTVSESGSFAAGSYTLSATGLTCGTLYHYHPYAINGVGSNNAATDRTFTTLACPSPTPTPVSVPSLAAPTASSITANSATLNGNITSTNNGTVTVRGFEYGTTVSYGNYITESGSFSTGAYTGSASSLTCATTYHFRSYATNSAGTASSSDQTLTTSACPSATPAPTPAINAPTIDSLSTSNISSTSVTLSANIASTGGENLSARGFNWGLTNIYGQNVNQTAGNYGVGSFSATLTGLTCDTAYHYRAYGTNSASTTYTVDGTFATAVCPSPSTSPTPTPTPAVTTGSTTNITATGAKLYANITSIGGAAVTRRGFQYGIASYTSVVCEDGSFNTGSYNLNTGGTCGSNTGAALTCGHTYQYQAFATNAGDTAFGAMETFSTPACTTSPTITNTSATSIGTSSAILNAEITSNGGDPVTSRGFNYGLTSNYGTNITQSSGPYNVGAFAIALPNSSLSCETTYHYRGFAENSVGRTNTDDATFTTSACPQATPTPTPTPPVASTTASSTNVTRSGATLIGALHSGTATERGFEYGLTQNYGTITKQNGTYNPGTFSLNVTGLAPSLTYHFRAYVKNAGGTSSSSDAVFITKASPGNLYGWAWSSTIGWINLNDVAVNQTTGDLTGYAWSSNIGWIKFGGLSNFPSGGAPAEQANLNLDTGEIKGWARACAGTVGGETSTTGADCSSMTSRTDGWDGWIELAGTYHTSLAKSNDGGMFKSWIAKAQNAIRYDGLKMDLNTGYITGMAWGSNVVGWVNVNASTSTASFSASCTGVDLKNGKVRFSAAAVGGSGDYEYQWDNSGTWVSAPYFDKDYVLNGGTLTANLQVRQLGMAEILVPQCSYTPSNVNITWDNGNPCTTAPTTVITGDKATVTVVGNLSPASTYKFIWNWGDGTASEETDSSVRSKDHAFNTAGQYTVTLTAIDIGVNSATKGKSNIQSCGGNNGITVEDPNVTMYIGSSGADAATKKRASLTIKKGGSVGLSWKNTLKSKVDPSDTIGYACTKTVTPTDATLQTWPADNNKSGSLNFANNIPTGEYNFMIKCTSDTLEDRQAQATLKVYESDAKEI